MRFLFWTQNPELEHVQKITQASAYCSSGFSESRHLQMNTDEEGVTTTMTNLAQLGMQLRSLHMDGHDGSCHGNFLQVYIVQV